MRRFEMTDGGSSKFWEVDLQGPSVVIRWGKIGTKGNGQTKSFAGVDEATRELSRLVAEKLRKGYQEVGAGAEAGVVATSSAIATNSPKTKKTSRKRRKLPTRGESALYDALDSRQYARALELLSAGVDVTPAVDHLIWCVADAPQYLQAFIDAGADVNMQTHMGTPVQVAARANDTTSIRLLLDAGADPNAGNTLHRPLSEAVVRGAIESALLLLSRGALPADQDTGLMVQAAALGNVPLLEALSRAGAKMLGRANISGRDVRSAMSMPVQFSYSQATPLIAAAGEGHLDAVRWLIERGVDLEALDDTLESAASLAAARKHDAVFEALRAAGASPTPKLTPSHRLAAAVSAQDANAVRAALSDGASPTLYDFRYQTLGLGMLQLAARLGDLETVTALIEGGAPVDGICDPEIARTHLRTLRPHLSCTPLTLAASTGNAAIVARLISAGANVDAQDSEGDTPLLLAVGNGHIECVRLLLEAGADPGKKNKSRESVKSYLKYTKPEIVELLKRKDLPKNLLDGRRDKSGIDEDEDEGERVETPGPYPWSLDPDVSNYGQERVLDRLRLREEAVSPDILSALEGIAGSAPRHAGKFGGFTVHVDSRRTVDVADVQRRFLDRNCFVFCSQSSATSGRAEQLMVLPTTDRYEAMAALGVNGDNYDISNLDVIRWMKGFEQEYAHTILELGFDTIVVALTGAVEDPERLARLVYAFCPDIVDQGAGDVGDLANLIAVQKLIYFWWD